MVRRSRPYDVLIRPRKQDGGCNGCLGLLRLIEASGSRLAACGYRGSLRTLALASAQIRVKEGPLAARGHWILWLTVEKTIVPWSPARSARNRKT